MFAPRMMNVDFTGTNSHFCHTFSQKVVTAKRTTALNLHFLRTSIRNTLYRVFQSFVNFLESLTYLKNFKTIFPLAILKILNIKKDLFAFTRDIFSTTDVL